MKQLIYNGHILQVKDPELNPNGRTTQTVLIYKGDQFIGATVADMVELENAIEKAKAKVGCKKETYKGYELRDYSGLIMIYKDGLLFGSAPSFAIAKSKIDQL